MGNTIVVEGEPLPDGTQVTVWAEDSDNFELDQQSLDELSEADAACARGEGLTVEQLTERMARLHAP